MSTDVAYHRRPIVRDFHEDYAPDNASVARCTGCGKQFLVTLGYTRFCRGCDNGKYTKTPTGGRVAATLNDVRAGVYTPGPELAATLRAHGQEISACPGCGRVRLRLVGQACGGSGCEKQRGLFV